MWVLFWDCQIIQAVEARVTKTHQGQSHVFWISKAFENVFGNEQHITADTQFTDNTTTPFPLVINSRMIRF